MPKISFKRGGGVKHPFADWNLLKPEIDSIARKLGHFPSDAELARMNRFDVRNSIRNHHGGFVKAQQKFGVAPKKKTGGASLSKWNNFSREMQTIAGNVGHFPSTKELLKMNRSDLHAAIKTHGGIDKVRQRMGFALGHRTKARTLKNWETFRKELESMKQKLGHFPSWGELESLERHDLLNGFRHHGGVIKVRQRLGEPLLIKTGEQSLRIWENLKAELNPIIEKFGSFPSTKLLAKVGRADLSHAILDFPGGANAVRKKFGFKPLKRLPAESFRNWQNTQRALQKLSRIFGHFPTDTELIASGNASLAQAIRTYHGGLKKAKERFSGVQVERKPPMQLSAVEKALFLKARIGSDAEKLALISHLEPIIRKWVGIESLRARNSFELRQDLRQEAIKGVLETLARSNNPNQFYGTVEKAVKGELKTLMRGRSGFSYNRKEYSQIVVIAQTRRRLENRLGRQPTIPEISKASLIPTIDIVNLQKRYPISLFQTDEHGRPLISKIKATRIKS